MKGLFQKFLLSFILLALALPSCSSSSKKSETPVKADGVDSQVESAPVADSSAPEVSSSQATADPDQAPGTTTSLPAAPPLMTAPSESGSKKYAALSLAVRAGKSESVHAELIKILGSNPNDAEALNTAALYYIRSGQYGAARLLLSRALEKNPNEAALYTNFGVIDLGEGEMTSAITNFKKALHVDPQSVEASANLGAIYSAAGDHLKAFPLLQLAYSKNHSSLVLANDYAVSLRFAKNYDEAAKVYDEALRANPRDANTYLNYAILLIDYMNKPKDGLALVYKLKFLETDRKDILARANALEKKAKSEMK
jgi:tetratricopeptide (TPR) repeat protein